MSYQPLNDCVLIEPEVEPDYLTYKGESKLVLPDMYAHGPEDRPKWGKVLSKGPKCRDMMVQVGHRVLYAKFGWAKVEIGNGKHLALVRELDLLAVDT